MILFLSQLLFNSERFLTTDSGNEYRGQNSMVITKEITKDHKILLYKDDKLIYTKCMNTGEHEIVDVPAYVKYMKASYSNMVIKDTPASICMKAKIRFKTPKEGGRSNEVFSGYMPNHVFEYKENGELKTTYIGDIQFLDRETLELGHVYTVTVRFAFHMRIESFMNLGRIWWIHEAGRQIGMAEIIEFEKAR